MNGIYQIVIGLVVGGAFAWLAARAHFKARLAQGAAETQAAHSMKISDIEGRLKVAEAQAGELRDRLRQEEADLDRLRAELDMERRSGVEAATRLDASRKNLDEQRGLIEAMKREMSDTFSAVSRAALESSNASFLALASERLGRISKETEGKLGVHSRELDGLLKPLQETLRRYEEQIRLMEEGRHRAYGSLGEQLKALASTNEQLQKETGNLVTALRKPQVRGRWGEIQLKRVAELAGMTLHCDFSEQVSVNAESGRLKPDMVVHLPMGREIVVDAKVSLDAYLDSLNAKTDEERRARIKEHAGQIRAHVNKLALKDYWAQFPQSPEFVVLFLPGESFFSAAIEADASIIEDGIEKNVIIATPTTFIALLRAIAYGWRQEQAAKNAREVGDLGRLLHERMGILVNHLNGVGSGLRGALKAYNDAVGSMETRLLPAARRFKDLGATGAADIPFIEQINEEPRNAELPPDDRKKA
jgi:DNA recombination protein RmuC